MKHATLLDIGCGWGATLRAAKSAGFQATGVEINAHQRTLLTKEGFHVYASLGDCKDRFDVLILSAILEHIPDPHAFLKTVSDHMHQNALLLVNVPNYDSWFRKTLRTYWLGFQSKQHVWQFTPKTLQTLLELNGFIVDKTELHALGKGENESGHPVYDSLGFLLEPKNTPLNILNSMLDRADRWLLRGWLGSAIRRLSEGRGADNLFIVARKR